jgi:DNA gyrase subunit B
MKIFANNEIADLMSIFGTGAGDDFDVTKLKFSRIVVACDADYDGRHIESLLETFFNTYTPGLIEAGKVYLASSPLYRIKEKGQDIFFKDQKDYDTYIHNEICRRFKFYKNGKVLSKTEMRTFLKDVYSYKELLEEYANDLTIPVNFLEAYAIMAIDKEGLTNFKQMFDLMKIEKKGEHKYFEGIIGNQFVSVCLDERFKSLIQDVRESFSETGINTMYTIEGSKMDGEYAPCELYNIVEIETRPKHRTRFKGLGELNPELLWDTTMNPEKRKMIKLLPNVNQNHTNEIFDQLMGKKSESRREFILSSNVNPKYIDI